MDLQKDFLNMQIAYEKNCAIRCNYSYEELKAQLDRSESLFGTRYLEGSPRHENWLLWVEAWQAVKEQAKSALLEQFEINNKLVEQIEKFKDQAKDTERLNFLLAGEHIRTVVKRDIENDNYEVVGSHYLFTELYWIDGFDYYENTSAHSERDAIDKAMLEAQEQSHD